MLPLLIASRGNTCRARALYNQRLPLEEALALLDLSEEAVESRRKSATT
jgi:hypothetical protein